MSKEWILNIATNRWGLNKKKSVGPVSEWIQEVSTKSQEEWETAYLKRLEEFLIREKQLSIPPQTYLIDLGRKLYIKITEVLQAEIESIEEDDCIHYIFDLVIQRTYNGYQNEIHTIYGQLQRELNVQIHPAPDEWDRLYNVDFFIKVGNFYIGLQIKPISYNHLPQVHNWLIWTQKTHRTFQEKYGGAVFIIFSTKKDGKKMIVNPEVVEAIKKEMQRLKTLS